MELRVKLAGGDKSAQLFFGYEGTALHGGDYPLMGVGPLPSPPYWETLAIYVAISVYLFILRHSKSDWMSQSDCF